MLKDFTRLLFNYLPYYSIIYYINSSNKITVTTEEIQIKNVDTSLMLSFETLKGWFAYWVAVLLIPFRGVFRTFQNIYNWVFYKNSQRLKPMNYFRWKLHYWCLIESWIRFSLLPLVTLDPYRSTPSNSMCTQHI